MAANQQQRACRRFGVDGVGCLPLRYRFRAPGTKIASKTPLSPWWPARSGRAPSPEGAGAPRPAGTLSLEDRKAVFGRSTSPFGSPPGPWARSGWPGRSPPRPSGAKARLAHIPLWGYPRPRGDQPQHSCSSRDRRYGDTFSPPPLGRRWGGYSSLRSPTGAEARGGGHHRDGPPLPKSPSFY